MSSETTPLTPEFITALGNGLKPEQLLTETADCITYGYDNSRIQVTPDAVVFPENHEQVLAIVQLCNQHSVPLTARGRGTGTTGASVPLRGGLVLSTEKMQSVLQMNPDDRYITVQPGLTNQAVQNLLAEQGYFWPPDPGSAAFCSIGGNLAYNSAGPRAVKYGTPRENVLGLRAVTGAGESIRTGVFTTKGVVGFDLTRLLIGSEGTLAIITEATLKLTPLAEDRRILQAIYRDIESATRAVADIMKQAIIPSALEFVDSTAINLIRQNSDISFPDTAGAMLMIELDGSREHLDGDVEKITQVATNHGLLSLRAANTKEEAAALWNARKALSPALRNVAPKKINEDIVVPVSNIPALIHGLEQLSEKYAIPIVNFGHAGNGNIHVNLLYDPDNPPQAKNIDSCLEQVFDLTLELKGSLSGEHGVGISKQAFIDRELDATSLRLMQQIKNDFDPNGILNPDKLFPE
ncbi:Fe-S protein, homolog of lactate dehydrogenase SO1521 [hydrothermal vent metagenome]|uniref:Fe-S protein, homolog of lactate dehydrogenase SO1521 n=1 Tax=hydrothermal vent metagenome TaxID=652676 RepID=A0A3B1C4W1_9ZZZZ